MPQLRQLLSKMLMHGRASIQRKILPIIATCFGRGSIGGRGVFVRPSLGMGMNARDVAYRRAHTHRNHFRPPPLEKNPMMEDMGA